MTEVFDTYTNRPPIYYILNLVAILFFGFLFFAWQSNLQISQKYGSFLVILVVAGLAAIIANVLFTVSGKMYILDGEMNLSSESIDIRSEIFLLKNIKKIEIKATDYKGARTSDGSGNWIEITNINTKMIRCRFVIKSKEQRDNLRSILKQWNEDGVNIDS